MYDTGETYGGNSVVRPVTGRLLYILAIVAFFFTFFNLQCGTAKLADISGFNMAVGGNTELRADFLSAWMDDDAKDTSYLSKRSALFGGKSAKNTTLHLPVNYWALGALIGVVLALIASLFYRPKAYMMQIGFAGGAALSLIIMLLTKSQYTFRVLEMDNPLARSQGAVFSEQVFGLKIAWGFWLAMGALVLALFIAIVLQRRLKIELENEAAMALFGEREDAEEPV